MHASGSSYRSRPASRCLTLKRLRGARDGMTVARRGRSIGRPSRSEGMAPKIVCGILGVLFLLIGAVLLIGGIWLAAVGGSWYYLFCGVGFGVSGALLMLRR